jgi:hypothetical protein
MCQLRSGPIWRIRPRKTDTLLSARQIGDAGYSFRLQSVADWFGRYQLAT